MSQRDLVAELRAARVEAPPQVRERVRLVAAAAPAPPRRFTWRRAFVVALPVAAALAAVVAFNWPSSNRPAADTERAVQHGAALSTVPRAAKAFGVPQTPGRAQDLNETLSLRVHDVSDAVKRAVAITVSLGGYTTSVHAATTGAQGTADLTLKVPRAQLQEAVSRLSRLGTITAEHLDVVDRQAGLNATDRLIARLQKQLAALRAQGAPAAQVTALTQRIERLQRGEATVRRTTRYATVRLHLATPAVPAAQRHGHGPLHGVGVALEWLGIGAVYALAIGLPVLAVLALAWVAARLVRRRREDALLSGR